MITCKSSREIDKMRASGRVTARALHKLKAAAAPGVTTSEIDRYAEELIRADGGTPAFLGYHGFSGSICTSVNDEVVHGIPGKRRLQQGDLLKIDIGSCVDGWFSDMACTVAVGAVDPYAQRLVDVTAEALQRGIAQVRAGAHLSDIGHAVQSFVEGEGFSVVRALVGHGIGLSLHEEPAVPNYGRKGTGPLLKPGMVIAIEPMVNAGTWKVRTKADKWTVVTADGGLSAHFEHTVAVRDDGCEILTALDAAQARVQAVPHERDDTGGELGAPETPGRIQAVG
jgi:methionyl aminopeptidase